MGLSLNSIGRSIGDWFNADSDEDQRKRLAAGQARYYADQQKNRPSYGSGISGLSNRVKDVFDSNTKQDYWRRQQSASQDQSIAQGRPVNALSQSYKQQQQSMGNDRPWENLGSQILGNTARFLNTGKSAWDEVYDTTNLLLNQAAGDTEDVSNINKRIKERQQRQYQPNSGLLGAGTIFDSPEEFNTLGAKDITKRVGLNTLGTASEVLPFARVTRPVAAGAKAQTLFKGGQPVTNKAILAMSAAERGAGGVPGRIAFNALQDSTTGAGESVARQYAQTGKIDPRVLGGDVLANTLLGQGQVVGGSVFNKALDTNPGRRVTTTIKKATADIPVFGESANKAEIRKLLVDTDSKLQYAKEFDKSKVPALEKNLASAEKQWLEAVQNEKRLGGSISDSTSPLDKERPTARLKGADDEIPTIESPPKTPEAIARDAGGGPGLKPELDRPEVTLKRVNLNDPFNNNKPVARLKNELGKAFVDSDSEMISFLRRAEKDTGQTGLVDNWLFNTNTQRAAPSIANAKMRQSPEFKQAFAGLSRTEAKEFDQYLAARAELKNYDGLPTSRTKAQLQKTVDDLANKYEPRFEAFNRFTKEPLDDLLNAGIIDAETHQKWLKDNDYIRIQRNMEDLLGFDAASRSRSLGSTSTKQKRTGSAREIVSPSSTAVSRRQQLQLEVQRNRTATETIDTLADLGIAKRVPEAKNKNVIKRLVNGQPEFWEVPKDIKRVIDNVNPYQLGVLARIVSTPARVFRAGTTALSAPFTVTNYLRDQASSAIYSKKVLATHAPNNVISGLYQAGKDFGTTGKKNSDLWDKFIAYAGDQTIYDELRNAKDTKRFLREARRGGGGKAFNMATAPIRSLEDLNSITEKATRFQNFKGIYQDAIKKGVGEDKAIREAVQAAYQNSVNFQRSGDVTRVLNMFIPYFNAGVQGSRNVARSFRDRPVGTTAKSVAFVAAPTAAVTAVNMGGVLNPESPEIYESIPDYEKQDNFIVILPGAKQDKSGRWTGIVKIPKPQGYRELTDPTRKITESYLSGQPMENAALIAKDMLSGLTGPINLEDKNKFASSFLPAGIKPTVQQQANKDFYTGSQIVPDFMIEGTEDPTKRAYKGTSGTAREIAKILGVEPVRVEKFVEDTFGSLGRYGLNTSDNTIKAITGNEDFVVGGRSAKSDFSRRMFEAGGELLDKNKSAGQKFYESRTKALEEVGLNRNEQAAYDSLHPDKTNFLGEDIFDENKRVSKYTKAGTYLQFPKTFEVDKRVDAEQRKKGKPGNPLFDLKGTQLNKVLLKQALPPGAKDDELDNLWKEDWYQDYQNANNKYYDSIKASMAKEGKVMPKSDNPYPQTPSDLQKAMDTYSSLPKGTGDRSAWIKANPDTWKRMISQWSAVDAWENKERVKLGLSPIEDEQTDGYSKYGSSSGYGGGRKQTSVGSEYKYAIGPDAGGQVRTPKVSIKKASTKPVARRKKIKPKVSVKKIKI